MMTNDYRVINGDCITNLGSDYADESVDLIATSPPYRAEKSYEDWESLAEYESFAREWMKEAARILTPTGTLMLNIGYTKVGRNETLPLTYLYHQIAQECGLKLVQEIVWRYYAGMAYVNRYTHRSERILWLTKDPDNCTFNLDDVRLKQWRSFDEGYTPSFDELKAKRLNPNGKNPTDIWEINHTNHNKASERRGQEKVDGLMQFDFDSLAVEPAKTIAHPAVFPEELLERIIKGHSNEGDLVLDPFLGTGTTMKVAHRLNRRCVGYEINRDYISIIKDRCKGVPFILDVRHKTRTTT